MDKLAIYVALEPWDKKKVESLARAETPILGALPVSLAGQGWDRALAAIHYGVDEKQAFQMLLTPRLERVVSDRDGDGLRRLSKSFGFSQVLEEIVEGHCPDWVQEDPNKIAWLASAIELPEGGSDEALGSVWGLLSENARRVDGWKDLDIDLGSGIARLVGHVGTPEYAESMLSALSKNPPTTEPDGESTEYITAGKWLAACESIVEAARTSLGEEGVLQVFRCPGNPSTYLEILETVVELNGVGKRLTKYLRPAEEPARIMTKLAGFVESGKYSESKRAVVNMMVEMDIEWPWDFFFDGVAERLRNTSEVTVSEVNSLGEMLLSTNIDVEKAEATISSLATSGHIFHHLQSSHPELDSYASAFCLYGIVKYNPKAVIPSHVGRSGQGVKLFNSFKNSLDQVEYALDELAGILCRSQDVNIVFDVLSDQEGFGELRKALLVRLVTRSDITALVLPTVLLGNESAFYVALGHEDYDSLVARYVDETELADLIPKTPFDPHLASLYRAVAIAKGGLTPQLTDWLVAGLQSIMKKRWVKEFEHNYRNLFDLIVALRGREIALDLGTEYHDALREYRNLVAGGDQPKVQLSQHWSTLLDALSPDFSVVFVDETIDRIVGEEAGSDLIIDLFGDQLLRCDRLVEKSKILIGDGFERFYADEGTDRLRWFAEVVAVCPGVHNKKESAYYSVFRDRVGTYLAKSNGDDERSRLLRQIAEEVKVAIPGEEDVSAEVGGADKEDNT